MQYLWLLFWEHISEFDPNVSFHEIKLRPGICVLYIRLVVRKLSYPVHYPHTFTRIGKGQPDSSENICIALRVNHVFNKCKPWYIYHKFHLISVNLDNSVTLVVS